LINLHKLAEQQKNYRAPEIKNRILKQTHDIKIAESLSPITKKLDEVKYSTQKLGDFVKESQPDNSPQLAIENTPAHQAIKNNEGVIYDVEIENTLKNMRDNTGFFKTYEDLERGWMLNDYPNKMLVGTEVDINNKKYNITPSIQKVLTDTSNIPLKKLNYKDREIYGIILKSLSFENYKPVRGETKSGRFKYSKTIFTNDSNLEGEGIEKFIIPSNIIDIYTRLEVLLGLKLSGHTDTLTEASNLIDELYKRGEIENKQQYRNTLNKL